MNGGHEFIKRFEMHIVNGRRDQAALTQSNGETGVHGILLLKLIVDPVTIQFGNIAQRARDCFEQQHRREQPFLQ